MCKTMGTERRWMAAIEVEMPFAKGRKVLGTTNEFPLGDLVSG